VYCESRDLILLALHRKCSKGDGKTPVCGEVNCCLLASMVGGGQQDLLGDEETIFTGTGSVLAGSGSIKSTRK